MTDRRKFNIPPKSPKYEKTYDKVLSVRVVIDDLNELKRLLNVRYGYKKIFLNSVSYVVRKAIKRKIRELLRSNIKKFNL